METLWVGGTKVLSNGHGHMTKVAAMPIYGKNLKILLLRNQKANYHETWYAALGTQVLPNSFKLTMTYFMARSNLVPYAFVWEKGKTIDFSETIVVFDLKLAADDQSDKKLTSKLCPLGAVCPLPRGYTHVLNHERNCIKSDFKEISLKLATNG